MLQALYIAKKALKQLPGRIVLGDVTRDGGVKRVATQTLKA